MQRPEVEDMRAFMKSRGLTQTSFCEDQLTGFVRKRGNEESILLEVTVDFRRMKVSATTVREPNERKGRNAFGEVDYREADWRTLDEASALIQRFCRVLNVRHETQETPP